MEEKGPQQLIDLALMAVVLSGRAWFLTAIYSAYRPGNNVKGRRECGSIILSMEEVELKV